MTPTDQPTTALTLEQRVAAWFAAHGGAEHPYVRGYTEWSVWESEARALDAQNVALRAALTNMVKCVNNLATGNQTDRDYEMMVVALDDAVALLQEESDAS